MLRSRRVLNTFGDERLVQQLRAGNETAFEVLYDRHSAAILGYCRHMLGSLHEAEDAAQHSFVSAHAGIISTDKPIHFKPWLYTIARNRCLSILRARREQPSDELEPLSTAGLSDEVQQRADLQELLVDLRELPEAQRTALVLSELGDLSHVEVAQVIGCEAAKVKSLVYQARSGLIERRDARDIPCEEIREQLATLRGGALRRGPLRRHLKACPGCTEFRSEVKRQRQMLAVALPVIPTLGLKESALAAVGATGSAAAGGTGLAVGGGAAAAATKLGVAKVAVIAVAAGGAAVGGGVAAEQAIFDTGPEPAVQQAPAGAGNGEGGTGVLEALERSSSGNGFVGAKDRDERNARDFAATRGEGRKLGLKKTPPGQTRAAEEPGSSRAQGKGPGNGNGNGNGPANGKGKAEAQGGAGKAQGEANRNPNPGKPDTPVRPEPKPKPVPKATPEPQITPEPRAPVAPQGSGPPAGKGPDTAPRTIPVLPIKPPAGKS